MRPTDAVGMADNADPDQTTFSGGVVPGFARTICSNISVPMLSRIFPYMLIFRPYADFLLIFFLTSLPRKGLSDKEK